MRKQLGKPSDPVRDQLTGYTVIHDHRGKKRPREKQISQYLNDNPNGKQCSRCGAIMPRARGISHICWRCTQLLANLQTKGYWNTETVPQPCLDCKGPRPKGFIRCPTCAKIRRREKDRERKRKAG